MKTTRDGADITAFLKDIEGGVRSEIRSLEEEVSKTVADDIFTKSQEYVPKDTGQLADSGQVVKTDNGYSVQYTDWKAFLVHENHDQALPLDARNGPALHGAEGNAKNYTTPGTGAKYLERAADEVANKSEMVKYVRDALGRFKKRIK